MLKRLAKGLHGTPNVGAKEARGTKSAIAAKAAKLMFCPASPGQNVVGEMNMLFISYEISFICGIETDTKHRDNIFLDVDIPKNQHDLDLIKKEIYKKNYKDEEKQGFYKDYNIFIYSILPL